MDIKSNIGDIRLADLGLPFLEVILEEVFFIPRGDHLLEKPRPHTIYDLAAISARPLDQVWQRLQEIKKISGGIYIPDADAAIPILRAKPVLFDVRFTEDFLNDPVPGAMHLPTMTMADWRSVASESSTCVTLSTDGSKAFSAAMWLREQGIVKAYAARAADIRTALTSLGLILLTAWCVLCSQGLHAADAEAFQTGSTSAAVQTAQAWTLQLFVQRPSLKILFGKDEAPERRSDQEILDGMNYEAESLNAVGLKASWNALALMATRRVGRSENLTTRKFEDYQLSHYAGAFGANVRYQAYVGMIQLMNYKGPKQDDAASPVTGDRSEYIRRPESSVVHRSATLRYLIWGRNFSMGDAFGETPVFPRRGFGFPLFVAAARTDFDTGGRLVDEKYRFYFNSTASLRRLHTKNAYIGGGAAGMIPWKKFFFSGQASFGVGGQQISVVKEENGADKARRSYDGAYKSDLCFFLGWNMPRAFVALTYDLEGTTFRHADIRATVQSDMVAAATGMRF